MIFLFKDYPDFQCFWPGYSVVTGFEVRMSGYQVLIYPVDVILPKKAHWFVSWDSHSLLYEFVKENYPEALL